MGFRAKLRALSLILTGRRTQLLAEERERLREDLVRPWFQARGDETLRLDYPLDAQSLVLDLGGYQGQFASDLYGRFRCKVFVFEPVPAFCEGIRGRFERNPDIQVFGFGLAGRPQTIALSVDGASTTAFGAPGPSVLAELKAVDVFFAEKGLDGVDLLKVNIEGGEYELLEAMLAKDLVRRVRYLQIQFHDHVPQAQARMEAIREGLTATHELQWCFPWIWESWRRKDAPR